MNNKVLQFNLLPHRAGSPWSPTTEDQFTEWEQAFPDVNVRGQLKSMGTWQTSHRDNPKSLQLLKLFIVTWLQIHQERATHNRASMKTIMQARNLSCDPRAQRIPECERKALRLADPGELK